jgi:acetylornithine deacetylase/succinyl-diaminopimelate desuccinylase-like protein
MPSIRLLEEIGPAPQKRMAMAPSEFRRIAEEHREEITALAGDLVRIDTTNTGVMPTGNETQAASHLARTLQAAGIASEIQGRVPERGNLFSALRGRSGRTGLVLVSHSDVVPAGDASQWTHPPFGGVIADGRLHGRGTADMKGTVAAQAMALVLLRRKNVSLVHDVGFVCVADEEAGGAYGMRWVAGTHPDRLRAACCLNEGGGSFVRVNGQDWCLLGIGEKGRYEVTATFHGKGAHAARPWQGENALYKAATALALLRGYNPERDTSDPVFASLDRVVGPVTPATVDEVIARLPRESSRLADHLKQVSRMVVTPTLISGGVKSNSVPDVCRLTCDVRALPHQGPAYVEERLRRLLPDADVRIDQTAVANASPASADILETAADILRRILDRPVAAVPTVSGGFTDSRFIRELGVRAYGWTPGHPDSDQSWHRAHGPNEAVAIQDLVIQTAAYMEMAVRFATAG